MHIKLLAATISLKFFIPPIFPLLLNFITMLFYTFREIVKGVYEMMACVCLDARLLQDEQYVQYRYLVLDPREGKHENLHHAGEAAANRCFRMSREECAAAQSTTEGIYI